MALECTLKIPEKTFIKNLLPLYTKSIVAISAYANSIKHLDTDERQDALIQFSLTNNDARAYIDYINASINKIVK